MMVARVVEDDAQTTPPCAMAQQFAQKGLEGAGIERRSKLGEQSPVAQIDRAKQGYGLACGCGAFGRDSRRVERSVEGPTGDSPCIKESETNSSPTG